MPKKKEEIGKMIFKVYDCVFGQEVHVLLNCTEDDLRKFYKKVGVKKYEKEKINYNFSGFSTYLTENGCSNKYVIFITKFNWLIEEQNTLIHEITHTIFKIWDGKNIPFRIETQEFFAQEVGNLYEDICKKIHKK